MKTPFEQALEFLFQNEGSQYVNDPRDAGGPTKYGVTWLAYAAYLGRVVTVEEIQALTIEQIGPFYRDRYWRPLGCERIEKLAIQIAVFDCGVLYGVGTAAILAQRALVACNAACDPDCDCGNPLKFDGIIGDRSIKAFNIADQEDFLKVFRQLILTRIDQVIAIRPKNEAFRAGWTNRANRLLTLNDLHPLNSKVT